MKTALAIRHLHFEDLGSLQPLLLERGYTLRYLEAGTDDLRDAALADLLVVLGGPIGAFDEQLHPFLLDELTLIERQLQQQRPLLGICLGAQLIARALGARVGDMGFKEIGFAPLTLSAQGQASVLAGLQGVPVLHWHGDRFELPDGAIPLAGTALCANQAFSVGRHVLALQCHLEAQPQQIERWLIGHACELSQSGIDPRRLRCQAAAVASSLPAAAQAVFAAWLDALPPSPGKASDCSQPPTSRSTHHV